MKMEDQPATGSIKVKTEDVCPGKMGKLTLSDVSARLEEAGKTHEGPEYWRSLEEFAGSEEFQGSPAPRISQGCIGVARFRLRRGFMKVMGASMALAGMTGCVKLPLEPIVPMCASGRSDSRSPDVLCLRGHVERICQSDPGREPSRPSD